MRGWARRGAEGGRHSGQDAALHKAVDGSRRHHELHGCAPRRRARLVAEQRAGRTTTCPIFSVMSEHPRKRRGGGEGGGGGDNWNLTGRLQWKAPLRAGSVRLSFSRTRPSGVRRPFRRAPACCAMGSWRVGFGGGGAGDDLDPRNQPDAEDEQPAARGQDRDEPRKGGSGSHSPGAWPPCARSTARTAFRGTRELSRRDARASRSSAEGRSRRGRGLHATPETSDEASRGGSEKLRPARRVRSSAPNIRLAVPHLRSDPESRATPNSSEPDRSARGARPPLQTNRPNRRTLSAPPPSLLTNRPSRSRRARARRPSLPTNRPNRRALSRRRARGVAADEPAVSKILEAGRQSRRGGDEPLALAEDGARRDRVQSLKQGAARGDDASSRVEEKRGGGGGGGGEDDDASDEYADDDFEEFEEGADGGLARAAAERFGHERGPTTSFVSASAAERKREARRRWARVRHRRCSDAQPRWPGEGDDDDDDDAPPPPRAVRRWSPATRRLQLPRAHAERLAPARPAAARARRDDANGIGRRRRARLLLRQGRRGSSFHPEIRVVLIERYDRALLPDLFYTGQEIDGFHRDAYAEEAERSAASRRPRRRRCVLLLHEKEEIAKKISAAARRGRGRRARRTRARFKDDPCVVRRSRLVMAWHIQLVAPARSRAKKHG